MRSSRTGCALQITLGPHADELALFGDVGIPAAAVGAMVVALGIAEILLAVLLVALWHNRLLAAICVAFAVGSTAIVAIASPRYLGAAFNPVTLNLGVLCLAAIDLLALPGLPSAGRCRRRPVEAIAKAVA